MAMGLALALIESDRPLARCCSEQSGLADSEATAADLATASAGSALIPSPAAQSIQAEGLSARLEAAPMRSSLPPDYC